MKKKLLLTLALGLSTVFVPAHSDVQEVSAKVVTEIQNKWPLIEKLVAAFKSGDFESLQTEANKGADKLNLAPLFTLLKENSSQMKQTLRAVLSNLESQVPADYIAMGNNALPKIDAVVDNLDTIKNNINLKAAINAVSKGLISIREEAKTNQAVKNILANLESKIDAIYGNMQTAYTNLKDSDFNKVAAAVQVGVKLAQKQKVSFDETIAAAEGFQIARAAIPSLMAIVLGIAQLGLEINNQFLAANLDTQLPDQAKQALRMLNDNATIIQNTLTNLNAKVDAYIG